MSEPRRSLPKKVVCKKCGHGKYLHDSCGWCDGKNPDGDCPCNNPELADDDE